MILGLSVDNSVCFKFSVLVSLRERFSFNVVVAASLFLGCPGLLFVCILYCTIFCFLLRGLPGHIPDFLFP